MGGILERIEARLERLEARLAKTQGDDFVDQTESELGRRKHCEVVKRLVEAGDKRAAIRGRRHLLTHSAMVEKLAELSLPKARTPVNDVVPDEELSAYHAALRKAASVSKRR